MSSDIIINSNLREIRVALMENNQLVELFIEHKAHKGVVGNVYKGVVTKILPGMQVAFVNVGLEKAGFLYVGDIDVADMLGLEPEEKAVPLNGDEEMGIPDEQDKPLRANEHLVPIQDLLTEGQEIIIQVAKNPLGTKGPRITSFVTLPGRNLVYMPTTNQISVSRRIEDEAEKERLKNIVMDLKKPAGGYIVRTASQGREKADFESDVNFLNRLWTNLKCKSENVGAPALLYEDLNLIFRSIRDLFDQGVQRLAIDNERDYKTCLEFCSTYLPHVADKIELYQGAAPIFDHYGIEIEINRALDRKVWLKSGGYISIDQTEALVAVDVNTGKYVGHSDPEETILKTNLEAVKEIVYQLRLRNIGGLIIVDFIDMAKEESKEAVWNALSLALKSDRSRTNILKISELGLVEMTRKRVRESLSQTLGDPCDYCEGKGFIKSPTTICYDVIRSIERIGANPIGKKNIQVEVHPLIYDLLVEEESASLQEMENQYGVHIAVTVNAKLHQGKYKLHAD